MIALSYSRISDFRQCKLKFKLKYIDKEPNFYDESKKSPHLIRGGNVHFALQEYVIKKKAGENDIPLSSLSEVERTKPLINSIMSIYNIYPELQIAIDSDFNQVDWYAKNVYFRVIIDLLGLGKDLLVCDYKTGKFSDYSGSLNLPGQLHLSSLIVMALYPEFEIIHNKYVYVDHKKVIGITLNRSEHFEPLKEKLTKEHAEINAEENFDENPNEFCHFCAADNSQCFKSRKSVKGEFAF